MFIKMLSHSRLCAIVLLTGALTASAQYNQPKEQPGTGTNGVSLTTQLVKTGLYVISGGGSNSVLRLTGNGLILVDGKLPGNYDLLAKRIRKISDQPVRFLIVTDHLESDNGNNAKFLEVHAQIIAQKNVQHTLAAYDPPGGKVAPPTITYDNEYMVRMGGVEVQLFHFGNAHTSGDTVVYYPDLKVVAVGDLFAAAPQPDYSAGGSLVGWGPVLGKILQLDFDVAVPSTGPPVTRAELQAFKAKIDTIVARATQLVNDGVPKDKLIGQLKSDDSGWQLTLTPDQLDHFYSELSRTEQPRSGS